MQRSQGMDRGERDQEVSEDEITRSEFHCSPHGTGVDTEGAVASQRVMVVGCGFLGAPHVRLLSRVALVVACDPDEEKRYTSGAWRRASSAADGMDFDPDLVVVCVPTDLREGCYDLSVLESVLDQISRANRHVPTVIRSTVAPGTTSRMARVFRMTSLSHAPEFLREAAALQDMEEPARVVAGGASAHVLTKMLPGSDRVISTSPEEAEAIKVFSNTYLATRVAFFNEVDSYCRREGISPERVIQGMTSDPRIGDRYCRPSVGFGGYCLPKEVAVAASITRGPLMRSLLDSNEARTMALVEVLAPYGEVGLYGRAERCVSRLDALADSLREAGVDVLVSETPGDLSSCRVIVTERRAPELSTLNSTVICLEGEAYG